MFWSFVVASILIELTPGPNMTWLAALGATRGRTTALSAVAGICAGLTIAAVVAGFGLSALLYEVPQLFQILRWGGTLYLFYLAWEAWTNAEGADTNTISGSWQSFRKGLVSNILNPKAYVFFAAVLPQFVLPNQDIAPQIVLLSLTYVAVATVIHAAIALLAGSAAIALQHSKQSAIIRKTLAILIAAAAVWFFYSTKVVQ
jgi:threonine/homoserine/homoserine lactone efflux protein